MHQASQNGEARLKGAVEFVQVQWRTIHTMQSVATQFGIDAARLTRYFRQVVGATPKKYVDNERKKFVAERMRKGSMLGYEIGELLGFPDDISFYRWVRRAFGKSFRQMQHGK